MGEVEEEMEYREQKVDEIRYEDETEGLVSKKECARERKRRRC